MAELELRVMGTARADLAVGRHGRGMSLVPDRSAHGSTEARPVAVDAPHGEVGHAVHPRGSHRGDMPGCVDRTVGHDMPPA
jgi:hypothetical protein